MNDIFQNRAKRLWDIFRKNPKLFTQETYKDIIHVPQEFISSDYKVFILDEVLGYYFVFDPYRKNTNCYYSRYRVNRHNSGSWIWIKEKPSNAYATSF